MATDKTVKTIFPVLGMSCAACAARVEKVLAHQPGVYAGAYQLCRRRTPPWSTTRARTAPGITARSRPRSGLRPGDRHRRRCRRTGGAGAGGTPPAAQEPHPVGNAAGTARHGDRHVLRGDALRRPGHVAALDPGGILAGTRVPHPRMAPTAARDGQHGHARGGKYGHGLPVQRLQHAVPGILARPRHRATRVFRGREHDRRLHPAG